MPAGEAAGGWQPLRRVAPPAVGTTTTTDAGGPSSFARLARTHALVSAADTLVAIALAGSLFFSISPDAARSRVALYLVVTMAPFAVVAPLIGPAIDRRPGSRRAMVVLSAGLRAVLCVVMAGDLDSFLLFPEAFAVLVLGKGYGVARASLVPGSVASPNQLVQANAKLVIISGVVGFLAAAPGVGLLQLGAPVVLFAAAAVFAVASAAALGLPKTVVDDATPAATEHIGRAELHGAGILLAASAMAVLRAVVGFSFFFLAFELRGADDPPWVFGMVIAASAVGALGGAGLAPRLRKVMCEERIVLAGMVVVTTAALAGLQVERRESAVLVAFAVGAGAGAGRLAFDAIVQRDAPDANHGRSFARFETRFQVAWVAGAFLPVAVALPLHAGYVGMALVSGVAAVSYVTGWQLTGALRRRAGIEDLGARVVHQVGERTARFRR